MPKIPEFIRRLMRSKKPQAPGVRKRKPIDSPHRGVAIGDRSRETVTYEEVRQWENIPGVAAEAFVYDGLILQVHSTNVNRVQYLIDEQKLTIEYKKGNRIYTYWNITEDDAISFLQAASKGGFCWDHLRIRGTIRGHQVPWAPGGSFAPEKRRATSFFSED